MKILTAVLLIALLALVGCGGNGTGYIGQSVAQQQKSGNQESETPLDTPPPPPYNNNADEYDTPPPIPY